MSLLLVCPNCNRTGMDVEVTEYTPENKLDIVLECVECEARFNEFVRVDDMMRLDEEFKA